MSYNASDGIVFPLVEIVSLHTHLSRTRLRGGGALATGAIHNRALPLPELAREQNRCIKNRAINRRVQLICMEILPKALLGFVDSWSNNYKAPLEPARLEPGLGPSTALVRLGLAQASQFPQRVLNIWLTILIHTPHK